MGVVAVLSLIAGVLTLIAAACAVKLAKRGIDEQSRIDKLNTTEEIEAKLAVAADPSQGGRPNLHLSLVNTGRVTIFMKSVTLWWPADPGKLIKGVDFTTNNSAPLNPGEPRIYWLLPAGVKEIVAWESLPEKLWVDIESFKGRVHRIEDLETRTHVEMLIVNLEGETNRLDTIASEVRRKGANMEMHLFQIEGLDADSDGLFPCLKVDVGQPDQEPRLVRINHCRVRSESLEIGATGRGWDDGAVLEIMSDLAERSIAITVETLPKLIRHLQEVQEELETGR